MSSVLDRMSKLERDTRRAWLANAVDHRQGVCPACGTFTTVARQLRRRVYECLQCWDDRS